MTITEDDYIDDKPAFGQALTSSYQPVAVAKPVSSNTPLDPQTVDLLSRTNSFLIQQRVRWIEAVSQGCCEQGNIYDVYEKDTKQKMFVSTYIVRDVTFFVMTISFF